MSKRSTRKGFHFVVAFLWLEICVKLSGTLRRCTFEGRARFRLWESWGNYPASSLLWFPLEEKPRQNFSTWKTVQDQMSIKNVPQFMHWARDSWLKINEVTLYPPCLQGPRVSNLISHFHGGVWIVCFFFSCHQLWRLAPGWGRCSACVCF